MKNTIRLTASFAALATLAFAAPAFADDHTDTSTEAPPMSAKDLVTMAGLGSPTVSPDGNYALYYVRTTDQDTFERATTFYLQDLRNTDADPVEVNLGGSASSPAFASDSWLYFLSDRPGVDAEENKENSTQVWRAALEGSGNVTGPMQVTDLPTDVHGFHVSPDAKRIAVFGDVGRDCPTFGCENDGTTHLPGPGTGRLYDGADGFYRHWDTWETPGTFSRLFAFDLENGKAVGDGVAADGPNGKGALVGDTPTKPFGGGEEIAWAADSSGLYFSARQADGQEPMSTNVDIYWSALNGTAPINLTAANAAYDNQPVPSPDGKWLAYTAMERPNYESDRLVIHLRNVASGETRALTENFDRSFGAIAWTPDSKWIIGGAQDVLDTPAFKINPQSGEVERLDLVKGNEARISGITPIAGNRLLFTRNSIAGPSEMYLSEDWKQAEQLTDVGTSLMAARAPVTTTRFSFAGANGETVWGQITKLKDHEGTMPAILYVHGGPQGSFNDSWSSRWNPKVVASQGYAVISVDFHGSTGYGQDFTDAINKGWGGKPLEDLQKGLAAALERDSQIDGTKACAMGASYGGYMLNWIAGKWPDRFDCLVQHDGLFDMRSFYYSTEELWFPRWDFGGSYAEATEEYEKWNPVNYVDNWKTPMLVITGEKDYRVPYSQGLQSFTALQERGIPSQLLVFPDENHWVLGRKNSLQWHNTVFDWLDRWLNDDSVEPSPDAEPIAPQ
ncbi:S9 family peptidase [Pontixanthobacter aestiaquae]|uniref:Prolyl oligopeptidase family serine peptidase n=1 Tax=Pontixanthobacter aestiaquae TaxID=1509367 RepID=A0A844Z2I2_9SPHN|nr:S9 family peptidase [Pontixanthobacter aestiaquae]MDN3646873.1 S9 family peptidase [Pontixanthobacter aestiaquae]MXO82145.1 prolyl oligopeptidase family serine peptidase [Pontixanthobacter aestiaquae]